MTFLLTQWKLIVIGVLVALLGVQQVRIDHAQTQLANERQVYAEERQKAADLARKAEQAAREEEQRREEMKERILDEAEHRTELAQTAARDAAGAADRLRERVVALVAAARSAPKDSKAAGSGASVKDTDAFDLLANVLARSDDATGQLAAYSDRLRIAGAACEQFVDGLKATH